MKNKEGVSIVVYDDASLKRARAWLNNFKRTEGVDMEVTIKPFKLTRSQQQNKLMWKWLSEIGLEIGLSSNELHEQLKVLYLKPILMRDDDNFRNIILNLRKAFKAGQEEIASLLAVEVVQMSSTTMLNTKQMTEYLEAIFKHAAEDGIKLTEPDPRKR